ncbi:hypothetical protein SDC9_18337 [bioreactor metagenome]|uniref:Uncharacterized protein n=1 Tax=bioreactor metagenome TaxID=1076179 RepID=A0A644U2D7_9ZZZZ
MRAKRSGEQTAGLRAYFGFVYGTVWIYEKKPTANRRESEPFGLSESDLLFLTFASLVPRLAHPFIGTVRANPVGAPAPPFGKLYHTVDK